MAAATVGHCPLCIPEMLDPKDEIALIFLGMDGVMIQREQAEIGKLARQIFPEMTGAPGRDYDAFVKRRSPLAGREVSPWEKETARPVDSSYSSYVSYCYAATRARTLDTHAVQNLINLIERVEKAGMRPRIVIASAWRNLVTTAELQEHLFSKTPFKQYICGKTPPSHTAKSEAPECVFGRHDFFTKAKKHGIALWRERADEISYWLKEHELDGSPLVVISSNEDHAEDLRKQFGERYVHIDSALTIAKVDEAFKQLCPEVASV